MDEENKDIKMSKKSFWKDKKNIAIIILSFLLLCFMAAYSDSNTYKYSSQIEELTNQVNDLNSKNNEQNTKLEENQKQIPLTAPVKEDPQALCFLREARQSSG